MSVLELRNISKRFGSLVANDEVSLSLDSGEILALLGENGAGKTTLMNILFGHYTADSGDILVNGSPLLAESTGAALKAGIGMVHQHFTLADNMSVLDNIILGTESLFSLRSNRAKARRKIQQLTHDLELTVDLDAQVSQLAIGERQRVEILKALYRDARVLILDEPTAVLTPQEVDTLFALLRRMAASGMSIILISHKLHEVLALSHRIAVLRHGKLVATVDSSKVTREELAALIVGRDVIRPVLEPLPAGSEVIALEDVVLQTKKNQKPLLNNISLSIHQHEIVGIAGVSGNGQSALALLLSGLAAPTSGSIKLQGKLVDKISREQLKTLKAARIPEDRHAEGVIGEMNLWENLMLEDLGEAPCWHLGLLNRKAARKRADSHIEQFDIRCASKELPVNLLSGGNMQKLILARNFDQQPGFVLANQPARGLDEGAISFVHQQLLKARAAGAAVLLISEDLDELQRLCDRIAVMYDGTLSDTYPTSALSTQDIGLMMTGEGVAVAV